MDTIAWLGRKGTIGAARRAVAAAPGGRIHYNSGMQIDHYTFGGISIAGRDYDADVIVFPDHVQDHWWRREGHRLGQEDLPSVLADPPGLLVIGTGYYGRMRVPDETLAAIRDRGIEVRIARTGDAVAEFNRRQKDYARTVAALHLTC